MEYNVPEMSFQLARAYFALQVKWIFHMTDGEFLTREHYHRKLTMH
jgi:hypothetical protein